MGIAFQMGQILWDFICVRYGVYVNGVRSKWPQVKTAPSQNIPKLVKTSQTAAADWSKPPQKTGPQNGPKLTGFK